MKKIATIATCGVYGFLFLGALADTGRSETLRYIVQSEELLYALHQIYLEKKVCISDYYLDQEDVILLQRALRNPAQALLSHSTRVLDRLNRVIVTKHYYQAQVYQNFDGLHRSYQIMCSMRDKFVSTYKKRECEKRLTAMKEGMKVWQRLIKKIQWEILTIGILLDQWVQRAATALSPHLLSAWLGYCSVALSPESFTELIDYCVQRYAHELKSTEDRVENYRKYLYMTMQKPMIKMNNAQAIIHFDALKPSY